MKTNPTLLSALAGLPLLFVLNLLPGFHLDSSEAPAPADPPDPVPTSPSPRLAPNANDGSGLPDVGFEIVAGETALVVTDPQNDFLSKDGVAWGVVGESVVENDTVANLGRLLAGAKTSGVPVFVSPHYYFPSDHGWQMEGTLERVMHSIGMFDRGHALDTSDFAGSGADWHADLAPFIEDGRTVVASPHKIYGPDSNDLVLQLRKRGISRVLLAGMSANLCTESHMRSLLEAGFEVAVVSDATAAAKVPRLDGYAAALTNFRMIASSVWTTEQATGAMAAAGAPPVTHGYVDVDGVQVFYREAGDPRNAKLVLLHGFPTSSQMFRDLIPRLARNFHVIAPDYPGYGLSDMPAREDFEYTFAHMADTVEHVLAARGFERYALYLMDYGAPVGFRLFSKAPDKVTGFVIQNGNAYDEGLRDFWDPIKAYWKSGSTEDRDALRGLLTLDATRWQYTHGTRQAAAISPDNWQIDQPLLDRPGNQEIQLDMFFDYRTNVDRYEEWQALFRKYTPPTLITWGKNDHIFPADGATPYLRDLPGAELHLLDTGHFALEEDGGRIAGLITEFLLRNAAK